MKVDKKAIPKYILPIIIHLKYKNIDSLKGWGKVRLYNTNQKKFGIANFSQRGL